MRASRALLVLTLAAAAAVAGTSTAVASSPPVTTAVTIRYLSHDGFVRRAEVLLPAGYRPGHDPALPLVISAHGRGCTGEGNARYWGRLPTTGGFAVVNPDGMGRLVAASSYGYAGQIDDLARMPEIVHRALPWVRIDRRHVYAVGSSMGAQETLLLVARHPRLLAGAVAMDAVTDLARRFRELPRTAVGARLRASLEREVGGPPTDRAEAYAERSPLSQAPAIAASHVPLELWWSRTDRVVRDQRHQSGALFDTLRRLSPKAPLTAYVGSWAHSRDMRSTTMLPLALAGLGLLPADLARWPHGLRELDA
jgi:dipeptidyl aminopeptidase/acylaminoacyl peptidase